MEVKQIHEIVNAITGEVTGKTDLVSEDLSNIVDVGTEVLGSTSVDNYVHKLVDRIGRVVFVNRPYSGSVPSVLKDGWEYGSILEKITMDSLPEAQENDSWNLTKGQSYDPNVFYQPEVSAKFFNEKKTFEIPMSFTETQVKESFTDATQLNGFMSMIYTGIETSMTVKVDSLIMRTIISMIGDTIHSDIPESANYSKTSGVKAVNLLYLYNQKFGGSLTKESALTNPEFIRFASYVIALYRNRFTRVSKLFNIGGKDRFTATENITTVLLNEFAQASGMYLNSETFHDDYVKLPTTEVVPYWQGSGLVYGFDQTSKIDVTTGGKNKVTIDGVIGVMFDKNAVGVYNSNKRVTSNYNPKAEFINNYYKWDSNYFNDFNENFVVFFVQ